MYDVIYLLCLIDYRYNVSRSFLYIRPVMLGDAGVYSCKAENQWGVAWLNFTVAVKGLMLLLMLTFAVLLCFSSITSAPRHDIFLANTNLV